MKFKQIFATMFISMILLSACYGKTQSSRLEAGTTPIRGVWITISACTVLDSKENIQNAISLCKYMGFNTVFVAVWDQSMTNYPSHVMENLTGTLINPRFAGRDPLKEIIAAAHSENIKVVAWFEYGFATSYDKPTSGGPIIERKPEWAARDSAGNIATKNKFQWMNSLNPDVQGFMLSLLMEVAVNYDVDGIQGDDRMPALPSLAGYDAYTVNLYKSENGGKEPPADYKDQSWIDWRAGKLNDFAKTIRDTIRKFNDENGRNIVIAMAPSVYPFAKTEYLQDWPAWVSNDYVDFIIPQLYRYNITAYQLCLDQIVKGDSVTPPQISKENLHKFYPGVLMSLGGKIVIDRSLLTQMLDANRAYGIDGEVIFYFGCIEQNKDFFKQYYGNMLLSRAFGQALR